MLFLLVAADLSPRAQNLNLHEGSRANAFGS